MFCLSLFIFSSSSFSLANICSLEAPDLQLYFSPLSYSTAPQGKRPLMSPDPYPAVRLGFNPTKPTSEGWISLKSSDPFESPKFVGNYLSTEEDKKVMISGMHLMRKFLKTKAMRDIVEEELSPGSDFNDDKSLGEKIGFTIGAVVSLIMIIILY